MKGAQKGFERYVEGNTNSAVIYAKVKDDLCLEEAQIRLNEINESLKSPGIFYTHASYLIQHAAIEEDGAWWAPILPWAFEDIFCNDGFFIVASTRLRDQLQINVALASRFLPDLKLVKKISKGKYLVTWAEEDPLKDLRRNLASAFLDRKRSHLEMASAFQAFETAKHKYEADWQAEKKLCYWDKQ